MRKISRQRYLSAGIVEIFQMYCGTLWNTANNLLQYSAVFPQGGVVEGFILTACSHIAVAAFRVHDAAHSVVVADIALVTLARGQFLLPGIFFNTLVPNL